jgi:methionyl-tRNA formyltransferase
MPAERIAFIGSKIPGLTALEVIYAAAPDSLVAVITLDDRSDVRSCYDQFHAFCAQRRLDFRVCNTRKETYHTLVDLNPTLCFVYGWYSIFDKATLSVANRGFLGVHPSLLPKYRGGASLVWSIIKGEREVGLSIFWMTEGLDEGDIVHQVKTPLFDDDTVAVVLGRLQQQLIEDLGRLWPEIVAGTAPRIPQDHGKAIYCAQRYPDDGRINWRDNAASIYNFVRAQVPPYPGAFFELDSNRIIVTRARLFGSPFIGDPGRVVRIGDGVSVACGHDSAIILDELLYKGERVAANTVLRSLKIHLS